MQTVSILPLRRTPGCLWLATPPAVNCWDQDTIGPLLGHDITIEEITGSDLNRERRAELEVKTAVARYYAEGSIEG